MPLFNSASLVQFNGKSASLAFFNGKQVWSVPNQSTGSVGGSIAFNGTAASYLSVTPDADLQFGSGSFTVEWWQYQTDNNSFPRVFQSGDFPNIEFGVSIEGGTLYVWVGGTNQINRSVGTFKNQWVHFAVTRDSNLVRIFKYGVQLLSAASSSANLVPTSTMRIGNSTTVADISAFGGFITNFHFVKGVAKYTTNFTPPTSPLPALPSSSLLLLATSSGSLATDSSGKNKTVVNTGTTWTSSTPF